MPNQIVTVDSVTYDLPQVVKTKLAEFFATIPQANLIAEAKAGQYISLNSAVTAENEKLVKRDANGFFEVKDGTSAKHPVSLSQLDARVPASGIPLATQVQPGLMSTTDKYKLDNAESFKPYPSGVAFKDLEPGYTYRWIPTNPATDPNIPDAPPSSQLLYGFTVAVTTFTLGAITAKIFYLNASWRQWTGSIGADGGNTLTWEIVGGYPTSSPTVSGLMSSSDKSKLNNATSSPTAGTIPLRDGNGRFQSASIGISNAPVNANDATRKDYVDDRASNASLLSQGTVPYQRLPLATSSVPGALPHTLYSLLVGAGAIAGADRLLKFNASGDFAINAPTSPTHPARKDYVDNLMTSVASGLLSRTLVRLGNTENLNDLITTEIYTQQTSVNATTALNYPIGNAGLLLVFVSADGNFVYQIYITYGSSSNKPIMFYRGRYKLGTTITWSAWQQSASTEDVAKVDSKFASGAVTVNPVANTGGTVRVDFPNGAITAPTAIVQAYATLYANINYLYVSQLTSTYAIISYSFTDTTARTIYWQAMARG